MNNSEQIFDQICRACMCKNQNFHSLYDKATDRSLTICEMFATILPQLPIHNNDEMSKVVCSTCLKTLIVVQEFQEMCVASDTYMRSLLTSRSLTFEGSTKEHPEDIKAVSNLDSDYTMIVKEDPLRLPSTIKVEKDGDEDCSDVEGNSPWIEEDERSLQPNSKLQDFIKFEISEEKFQECDMEIHLNAERESSNVKNKSANWFGDTESDTDSAWSANNDSGRQGESVKEVQKTVQHRIRALDIDIDKNQRYEIEKPNSLAHRKYRFRCEQCNTNFISNYRLQSHSVVHLKSRKFVCETCSFRFENARALSRHNTLEHEICPPEGYKCPKCPRRFEMRKSLMPHMLCHRLLKCKWCKEQFENKELMLNHLRKHTEYQKEILTRHKKKSISEQDVGNKVAALERVEGGDIDTDSYRNADIDSGSEGKSLTGIHKLEQHKTSTSVVDIDENQTYEIEKPNSLPAHKYRFRCRQCNACFDSNYKLKQHCDVHLESRKFVCETCSYRFKTSKGLSNHITLEHEICPPEGYKCPKCPRRFEMRKSLTPHMVTHRLLKCKWCKQKFGNKERMLKHVRKHPEYHRERLNDEEDFEWKANDDISFFPEKAPSKEETDACQKNERCINEPVAASEVIDAADINETDQEKGTSYVEIEICLDAMDSENNHHVKSVSKINEKEKPLQGSTKVNDESGDFKVEKPYSQPHRNYSFRCDVCNAVFPSNFHLKRHSHLHLQSRQFACELCSYRFKTAGNLAVHKRSHDAPPLEGFKCPICSRRFEKFVSLSTHFRNHQKTNPEEFYKCEFCPKKFKKPMTLMNHERTHFETQKYDCLQCDATFELSTLLEDHININHELKSLVCEYCKKEFKTKSAFEVHRKQHEKPYLCPQCGKSYGTSKLLNDHLRRHAGEKLFQCPECPRKFSCSVDRRKHRQIHVDTKRHVCDICGQKFARSECVKLHKMAKHSDERPFKCSECDMTFKRRDLVIRHMRTHTGEKPYKCKFCEKAYSEPGDLTKHLRLHVGEKTYMCNKCPEKFKYFKELRDHEAFHYRQQQQANEEKNKELES